MLSPSREVSSVTVGQIAFGPFRLDRDNALLWRGDERIPLAPKPFEILAALAERPGDLITKEKLLATVWGGLHVSDSSLTVAMNTLRAALADDPAAPQFIETVPRRGYRFIARVISRSSASRDDAVTTLMPEQPPVRITGASDLPKTHYARSGELNLAYQVMGDGPIDLIVVPGLIAHVEFLHELPG
jgi:DNA-binding winged helix-turn-helix (wHTH) protein